MPTRRRSVLRGRTRSTLAIVAHVILVGVLAPGLAWAPLAAVGERSLMALPVMIGLTFILSWWITIPLAIATCACYAMSHRIRRASVAAHVAAWALIGGLSAHAWTLLAPMNVNPILMFDGIAALSGVAIGMMLFALWRPKASEDANATRGGIAPTESLSPIPDARCPLPSLPH